MTQRDEFPADVKVRLAKRAAYRCSHPSCRASTIGPSDTRAGGVSEVGTAAHITAAAPKGPRYDSQLTKTERRSEANGIWLCATHGRAVDNDDSRHTVSLLLAWKEHAEEMARVEQGMPMDLQPFDGRSVFDHEVLIEAPLIESQRQVIAEFLDDTQFSQRDDQEYDLLRMLLQELADNWFRHGSAAHLCLRTDESVLSLTGPDRSFSLTDLALSEGGSGGAYAWRVFDRDYAHQIWVNERVAEGLRSIQLGHLGSLGATLNPCGVELVETRSEDWHLGLDFADCKTLHVYLPDRPMFSDLTAFISHLEVAAKHRAVVLHGIRGGDYLAEFVREKCPSVRIA